MTQKAIFDQVNIVSGDLEASIAFYRRLGVRISEAGVWRTATGIHHVSAEQGQDTGTADLDIDSAAFARIWNAGWHGLADLGGRVVLGFRLPTREAVDESYAELTVAGHRGLQAPYDAFWGARYAVVEDPDGIAVGLMSPISPERKSRPPDV
jgi:catechol 2,3-dioxygenase-like lactoylglutathione lyase family enzyme